MPGRLLLLVCIAGVGPELAGRALAGEAPRAGVYPRLLTERRGAPGPEQVAALVERLSAALQAGEGLQLRPRVELEQELARRHGADFLACTRSDCATRLARALPLRHLVVLELGAQGPGCDLDAGLWDLLHMEVLQRTRVPADCQGDLARAGEALAARLEGWSLRAGPARAPDGAGSARLRVTSDPAGAWLELDGRDRGRATGQTLEAPPGKHRLRVEFPCHLPLEREVELAAGTERALAVALEPQTAWLRFQIRERVGGRQPRAEVWLDGKLLGPAERGYRVPACGHQVELRARDGRRFAERIWLNPVEAELVQVELRAPGEQAEPADPPRYVRMLELKPEQDLLARRVERCFDSRVAPLGGQKVLYQLLVAPDGAPYAVELREATFQLTREERRCALETIDRFRFRSDQGWDGLGTVSTWLTFD